MRAGTQDCRQLGVQQITALVQKSETSSLWRKVGLIDVVSPRTLAAQRIRRYIDAFGQDRVETFLDVALSLDSMIDPYLPLRERLHRSFPREMDAHDITRVVKAYGAAAQALP